MGKITPEMVLEAYKKTGLEPTNNCFIDGHSVCPLTVLTVASGVSLNKLKLANASARFLLIISTLKLDTTYANAFMIVIDNGYECGDEEGAIDARAVAKALNKAGYKQFREYAK